MELPAKGQACCADWCCIGSVYSRLSKWLSASGQNLKILAIFEGKRLFQDSNLLEPLLMNLMATSFILCLSSAKSTKAELPRPSSATFTYLVWSFKGSGVVFVSRTEVGVLCVCAPLLACLYERCDGDTFRLTTC